ncbi:MAG: thiamine pyrophosphate-dependent enzyme, partial [Limisphaerales bacterium]
WEQRVLSGDPKFEASQNLPEFPYATYAEMLGLKGIRLDKPDDVVGAWEEALNADRPVVIDAHTDPEVPPLPPHISVQQARHFMKAMVHEPERGHIVRQSFKDGIESFVPH